MLSQLRQMALHRSDVAAARHREIVWSLGVLLSQVRGDQACRFSERTVPEQVMSLEVSDSSRELRPEVGKSRQRKNSFI